MPWKTDTLMEKRMELVSLARSGEFTVSELAERFEVSRKTAHKWIDRYEDGGTENLIDRSRAPKHSPQRTSKEVERLILRIKRAHSTWGTKKIRVLLARDHGIESPPAVSTVGEILKRHGLVRKKRRRAGVYPAANRELTDAVIHRDRILVARRIWLYRPTLFTSRGKSDRESGQRVERSKEE